MEDSCTQLWTYISKKNQKIITVIGHIYSGDVFFNPMNYNTIGGFLANSSYKAVYSQSPLLTMDCELSDKHTHTELGSVTNVFLLRSKPRSFSKDEVGQDTQAMHATHVQ